MSLASLESECAAVVTMTPRQLFGEERIRSECFVTERFCDRKIVGREKLAIVRFMLRSPEFFDRRRSGGLGEMLFRTF